MCSEKVIERVIWIAMVIVVGFGGCLFGHMHGRQYASIESWLIGYDQGYNIGINDAATAYDSGGEIVDVTTGKVTRNHGSR